MKLNITLFLLVASAALISAYIQNPSGSLEDLGFQQQPHQFGAIHHKRDTPEGQESIVEFPSEGLFSKEEHYHELYDSLIYAEEHKEEYAEKTNAALIGCENNDRPDFFKWAPIYVGTVTPSNPSIQYTVPCFQDSNAHFNIVNDNTIELIHVFKKPKDLFCTDTYFYSTLTNFHVEIFARRGTHKVTFKVKPDQLEEIKTVGISIFRICDKTIHIIPDFFKSLWLFLGGLGLNPNIPFFGSKPTKSMIKKNIEFLEKTTGHKWQKRPKDTVVEIDESLIQSGDFFAIIRFDGLDPIIGYGSGSFVGHCTMALRVKGEVYIVESQSGWYWPRTGIQINPYKLWIKWARNAGFQVTWLPLKSEVAARFDNDAAYKFFKTIEGVPYGYHNFLFGWLDTAKHNYPPVLSPEAFGPLFAMVEKISPEASNSVFNLAMNRRLNTTGLSVPQIAVEAEKRGLTIPDLLAMVEVDGWVYPDGVSYVCSSFVVAMYKAAGLFGNAEVNAVEFTPKDLYSLDFFSTNPPVPENCKKVDPENPFCQIMGEYRMEFPGLGTVSPYSHMNENCWSEGPDYKRVPEGC